VTDYAIFMLDPDGRVATWNEGARRINGYEADEIIGMHFSAFYTPEAIAAGHPDRELEIARAEGRFGEEAWRVRKDGTRFFANVLVTALFDDAGELRGFGKVTRDITERVEAQERLSAATAEAERHRVRRAHALEIHDNIIQGLVLAKYAQEYGDVERAATAVDQVLAEARRIVGELQAATGPTEPGQLRRMAQAPSIDNRSA
jgi:PAS domain S-box-containing protein